MVDEVKIKQVELAGAVGAHVSLNHIPSIYPRNNARLVSYNAGDNVAIFEHVIDGKKSSVHWIVAWNSLFF